MLTPRCWGLLKRPDKQKFASSRARPSGTEDVYKLYAESFTGRDHLARIHEAVPAVIRRAFQVGAMA